MLIFVLVWMARQDKETIELSPGGSAQQPSSSAVGSREKVAPLEMSWATPGSERGSERRASGGATDDASLRLRIETQESGYVMVVQVIGEQVRRLIPAASSESMALPDGSAYLAVNPDARNQVLQGVHCAFPFAFEDLRAEQRELRVPNGCVVVALKSGK